ncbi:MAG: hypothetical protein IJ558_01770 [Treponema sp.]|nr:hypothetical protein [Treponema sp.]
MRKVKVRISSSSNRKIDVSSSLIQRANSVIMRMSRDEIVDIAKQSQYLITGAEINKIYSHVNKIK